MPDSMIFQDLNLIVPEILLVLSTLFGILISSYSKSFAKYIEYFFGLILAFCIYFVVNQLYFENIKQYAFYNSIFIDPFSLGFKLVILTALLFILMMVCSIKQDDTKLPFEIPCLIVLSGIGMIVMVESSDFMSLYLGLELMSFPLYILVTSKKTDILSSEAGLKYFVLGAIASCIYLFGTSIIYGFASGTSFERVASYYIMSIGSEASQPSIPIVFLIGFILILIAFSFKASAAPFHMWTPDVYQGSPTIATAFLASVPKISTIAVLSKILYFVFIDLEDQWQQITIFISLLSIIVGSFTGIVQKNLKRLLAYSTIAHIGFIFLGFSTLELSGLYSATFYIILYLIMTIPAFAILLVIEGDGKHELEIKNIAGIAKKYPYIALAFSIFLFSMAGIPPFSGFFAKLYVLSSIIEQEMYFLSIVAVLSTVASTYYYLKVVKVMYFDPEILDFKINCSFKLKAIIFIGVIMNTFYIIAPQPIFLFAKKISESLISI